MHTCGGIQKTTATYTCGSDPFFSNLVFEDLLFFLEVSFSRYFVQLFILSNISQKHSCLQAVTW